MQGRHKEGRNGSKAQWHKGFAVCNSPFDGASRVAFFDRRSFSGVGSEAGGSNLLAPLLGGVGVGFHKVVNILNIRKPGNYLPAFFFCSKTFFYLVRNDLAIT